MRKFYSLLFILLIISCGTGDDEKELSEVIDIAKTVEKDYNNYYSKNILNLFSPTRLAMRLGKEFYDIPKMERQYVYSFLRGEFETATYSFMEHLDQFGLEMILFDVHKEGDTYRANYQIQNTEDDMVSDFVVLYIEKDMNDRFKIVNFYSLEQGFSHGQIFKDIFKSVQDESTSNQMLQYESMNIIHGAKQLYANGMFEKAYDYLKTLRHSMLKKPGISVLASRFASKVSQELYLEELRNMKEITPNKQSKLYYDCVIQNIQSDENGECTSEIESALIKS